jgi:hypothetical protein
VCVLRLCMYVRGSVLMCVCVLAFWPSVGSVCAYTSSKACRSLPCGHAAHVYTSMHANMQRTCIQACMQTCSARVYKHACKHAVHVYTSIHANTHTRVHAEGGGYAGGGGLNLRRVACRGAALHTWFRPTKLPGPCPGTCSSVCLRMHVSVCLFIYFHTHVHACIHTYTRVRPIARIIIFSGFHADVIVCSKHSTSTDTLRSRVFTLLPALIFVTGTRYRHLIAFGARGQGEGNPQAFQPPPGRGLGNEA